MAVAYSRDSFGDKNPVVSESGFQSWDKHNSLTYGRTTVDLISVAVL